MTITEMLAMPKGMSVVEYDALLKEKKRLEKRLRKAGSVIDDENASLEVLVDEVESDRYQRHLLNKQKYEKIRDKALEKLRQLEERLK